MNTNLSVTVEETVNVLEIETAIDNQVNTLDIDLLNKNIVEIVTGFSANAVFASDIIGLDNYLSNFIDTYNIDCGSP